MGLLRDARQGHSSGKHKKTMSKKRSKKGRVILILLLLGLALFLCFGTGGGGGGTGAAGTARSFAERAGTTLKQAVSAVRVRLAGSRKTAEAPRPAPPVSFRDLAAWSGAQEAASEQAAGAPDSSAQNKILPAGTEEENAGFPGVILLRYDPPHEERGFSARLTPFGTKTILIRGRTAEEFCGRLAAQLDMLAQSSKGEYTRFYALETGNAGSSQTHWLRRCVKEKFPGILYENQSSTKEQ